MGAMMLRCTWLALAAPMACSTPSPRLVSTSTTESAAAVACRVGPRVYTRPTDDGLELRADPAAVEPDELAIVDWRSDLDGDGRLDLGLSFDGSTGSKGESLLGAFLACGGDQFVAVWGPEYAFGLGLAPGDATPPSADRWRRLLLSVRMEHPNEPVDGLEEHTLRFVDGRYREDVP